MATWIWISAALAGAAFVCVAYALHQVRETSEDVRELRIRLDGLLRMQDEPASGAHHDGTDRSREPWAHMQQRFTTAERWADDEDAWPTDEWPIAHEDEVWSPHDEPRHLTAPGRDRRHHAWSC